MSGRLRCWSCGCFNRTRRHAPCSTTSSERWRLSGNTVMIAGTDLADRTLDADDIFQFLDRKLAQRFIVSRADVARRTDAFDMMADIDGRYRVNECYCHHTTWQDALQALVRYSDVVLMDLRGFQAHNAGCRYSSPPLRGPRASFASWSW